MLPFLTMRNKTKLISYSNYYPNPNAVSFLSENPSIITKSVLRLNINISGSEAQRKWKLLIVPLHEENTSLEYISYQELELRYEVNLQIVAGGDEKRCQ